MFRVQALLVASLCGVAESTLKVKETSRPVICEATDVSLVALAKGPCPSTHPEETRRAGVNIFDIFWLSSSGQPTAGNHSDAMYELQSAQASGVKIFRFFANLWGPNMAYFLTHEDTYWRELDAIFDEIERLGLFAIPSLGYNQWHLSVNKVHGLSENLNDFVRNASSVSQTAAKRYFDTFVKRYTKRSCVLMWELGNELNLMVNLPPGKSPTDRCGLEQCFNTKDMVTLTSTLAQVIRASDPQRPISSGYAAPRKSAWHQENCPYKGKCAADPNGGYWTTDTREQWLLHLRLQNSAVEYWSVHVYDDGAKDCYFNESPCVNTTGMLLAGSQEAKAAGAALYVGEYGGPGPTFVGPTAADQRFPKAILSEQVHDKAVDGSFTLSTIWAWACASHRADMVCIYPNSTVAKESGSNEMVRALQDTNQELQNLVVEI